MVGAEAKASLNERRARLDPVSLLHSIRETQSALAAFVSLVVRPTPRARAWNGSWRNFPSGGGRM